MLKDVLRKIYGSQVFSSSTIAKELDISQSMVDEMVTQLIRMGYISEDLGSPTCQSKCAGCSISSCKTIPIKMLSITDKGKRLINN